MEAAVAPTSSRERFGTLAVMARRDTPSTPKEPGRIAQLFDVLKITLRHAPINYLWLGLSLLAPIAAGIVLSFVLFDGNWLFAILWIVLGLVTGALLFVIVLGRRAQRAIYEQNAGRPGAVGLVLRAGLSRRWQTSEMPIAVNPRSQDAVYRAVSRSGVVLIAEGPRSRTAKITEDARRQVHRVVPSVPIHVIQVGPDADSVPLTRLARTMNSYKRTLSRAEVLAVGNRLSSITTNPMDMVPKGIDPRRVRVGKPR